MEVVKPSWIKHHDDKNRRQCIFSTDIDREGKRCASGGMDGVIRIWRVSAFFESLEERQCGNLLASMSRHNGSVLCVRWSSTGLLASSSDDTIILIWQLDSRPVALRGNLEGLNDDGEVVENYKVVKRLIGHQSDTVGVEWSPDGKVLASCSLDGTICFWNADPSNSQTLIGKIERAHAGFIKGLAWDPTGRFLASQSDDGSCVVWNMDSMLKSQTSGFTLDPSDSEMFKETVLEKMFINMSKMTFFHRPGWSPDGTLLALANATNRQIPAVAIVERSNWQGPGTFFIGHLGPVEAVRFCPKLFKGPETTTSNYEMLCALASQDGQVSIWSSAKTNPLLVLQDLFEHSVMDLAWTPDGRFVIAVSYDGAAVVVRIDSAEFGLVPLSESEQFEHFKNVCGNRLNGSDEDGKNGYIENVKVIECLRENEQFLSNHPPSKEVVSVSNERPLSPMMSRMELGSVEPALSLPSTSNLMNSTMIANNVNVMQTTIVNGKKRITPQLVHVTDSSMISSQSQPPAMRATARFRDEDFIVSRKLLERSAGLLVKSSNSTSIFEIESPVSETSSNLSLSLASGAFFTVSIEITNYDICGRKASSLLQFVQNSQIVWKERIKGTIYTSCGFRKFSAFALQSPGDAAKHFLLVLTAAGRRYFPLISMDSQIVFLNFSSQNLSAVTANGSVYIWDLQMGRIKFSDSTLSACIDSECGAGGVKFIKFNPENLEISYSKDNIVSNLAFNSNLGFWISDYKKLNAAPLPSNTLISSSADRADRIEKLKAVLLNAPDSVVDRQMSELEFELSLIFVNMRNGHILCSQESAHFERILAIYAIKLAKEGKTLKASELLQDLTDLKQEELVHDLLKPFFTSLSAAYSSHWQDFISIHFK